MLIFKQNFLFFWGKYWPNRGSEFSGNKKAHKMQKKNLKQWGIWDKNDESQITLVDRKSQHGRLPMMI